jgi:hypothetical protein
MKKVIRNYPLQIDVQNFSTWKITLPIGAEVVGFAQIGAVGQMFVLQDEQDEPVPPAIEQREFLTATVGLPFEAPERLRFLGCLVLTDNTPRFMSTLQAPATMIFPLIIFEVLQAPPAPDKITIH